MYLVSWWSLNPCGTVLCIVIRQIDLYGLLYTQPFGLTCTICWIFWDFFQRVFLTSLLKKVLCVDMCPSLSFYFIVQCVCLGANTMLSYLTALCVIQLEFENSKISSGSFSYPNFCIYISIWRWICPFKICEDYVSKLMGVALDL